MRVRHRLVPLLALVSCTLGASAACGFDDEDPNANLDSVVVRFRTGGSATPAFLDVPYPTDLYLRDGRITESIPLDRTFKSKSTFLAKQLGTLNGWSRIAPALFAIDDYKKPPTDLGEGGGADVDTATLPADEDACRADGSSVFLLDLEATDPAKARIPCRATVLDERELESGRFLVGVGPARGVVLEEGHRYCAVLTSRVRTVGGGKIVRSAELSAMLERQDTTTPLGAVYVPTFDKVKALLGSALDADKAEILGVAPYTTQKITGELYALRDALEAAPPATLSWSADDIKPMTAAKFAEKPGGVLPAGFTASLDDWLGVVDPAAKLPDGQDDPDESLPVRAHDKLAAFGTAVFTAKSYLRSRPDKYDDLEHATFARDAAGNFVEQAPAKVWVSFAVPNATMPAAGYPTVIIQHGLSGSRAYLLSMANRFAAKGWMAVAIDSVTFGARTVDPKFLNDATSDYAAAPGNTYKGGDGISDAVAGERAGSFELFGGLKNLIALRDQLRQAELDTAQLVKVLRANPDLSPLATKGVTPKIDPDRIAYVGDSLGAIEGAVAAAIEPRVKAWTFNVGGGGVLTEIAAHGPAINSNLTLAGTVNFGFGRVAYTEAHPVVVIGQTLIEGADPIAFAKRLVTDPAPLAGAPTPPRNVLQIEVLFDELVANEGNEALARAAGYGLATPNVGPNAGMADLASRQPYRGGGIKLDILPAPPPDGYHDTPKAGVTALLIQASPGQHGHDLTRSKGNRNYRIPYNTMDGKLELNRQDLVPVPCPYRALQETMVGFFQGAFDGKVPVVTGFAAPIRDTDGDGRPDDSDPLPVAP